MISHFFFFFCFSFCHWGLENNTNQLQSSNWGNWMTDVKSIRKYCTPLKQKQLELCSSQIFIKSVPGSTKLPLVQKRIQSCYLPSEVGDAFERELGQLSPELGHGRREDACCYQEQRHRQWEHVRALIKMTLELGKAWIQALTSLLLIISVRSVGGVLICDALRRVMCPLPCPVQKRPQGGGSEYVCLKSL